MSAKEIVKNLKKARSNYRQIVKAGVIETALEVRNIAVTSIQELSNGKLTTVYKQGGTVERRRVSAEGDAPNTDTGRLQQSIAWEMAASSYKTARVGTNVEYAPALEFGTRYMAARPFLQPALEKVRQANLLAKNITKAANHL